MEIHKHTRTIGRYTNTQGQLGNTQKHQTIGKYTITLGQLGNTVHKHTRTIANKKKKKTGTIRNHVLHLLNVLPNSLGQSKFTKTRSTCHFTMHTVWESENIALVGCLVGLFIRKKLQLVVLQWGCSWCQTAWTVCNLSDSVELLWLSYTKGKSQISGFEVVQAAKHTRKIRKYTASQMQWGYLSCHTH